MHIEYVKGQLIVAPLTNDEERFLLAIADAYETLLRSTSQAIEPVVRCSKVGKPQSVLSRLRQDR